MGEGGEVHDEGAELRELVRAEVGKVLTEIGTRLDAMVAHYRQFPWDSSWEQGMEHAAGIIKEVADGR